MRFAVRAWARLFPNPGYYGWAIVAAGFFASALTSPGQSFVISLYLEPVMGELGLSRVAVATLYSAATLGAAVCLPFIGGLADRVASGRFLAIVIALIALSMVGFAAVETALALGFALFCLRLLGQGAVGLATLTATVRWFRRYRGRALAVVALGYAFGQLVFPGAVYFLVDRLGWRGSLLALAAVYLVLAAPLIALLMRERRPDDAPLDGAERAQETAATALPAEASFTLHEALRTSAFWALLACVSIPPLVHTAVIFHQVALFDSAGWGAAFIPAMFVAFALASVVTSYATGLVLERTGSRPALAASLGFSAVALLSILLPLPPVGGVLLYGTLLGAASGAHASTNSFAWPEYFGVDALGAVKGVVNGVRNGASAVGPPLAALLISASGAFTSSITLLTALSVLGAAGAFRIRRPPLVPRPDGIASPPDPAVAPRVSGSDTRAA